MRSVGDSLGVHERVPALSRHSLSVTVGSIQVLPKYFKWLLKRYRKEIQVGLIRKELSIRGEAEPYSWEFNKPAKDFQIAPICNEGMSQEQVSC